MRTFRGIVYLCVAFMGITCSDKNPDSEKYPPYIPPIDVATKNTVFVVFKTHLDVGFTDLSSRVEQQYLQNDIPAALDVIDAMRATGTDRYIWTTGTWILSEYLERASSTARQRLETAIFRGDIVWNAMPYTIQTEVMTAELLDGILEQSRALDRQYGKTTLAAKMTDVPGHTRSMIPSLRKAGIRLLHVGLNRSVNEPEIPASSEYPEICRWRHPDGSTIIFMQKKAYSHEIVLPDGNILSMNVKGDNNGPHTVAQVQNIYKELRKKYPDKEIRASSLNEVAEVLTEKEHLFPVMTGEIGDTWIHGCASAPNRMSGVLALYRLYRKWVCEGAIDQTSDWARRFALRLGLVAEHTWGADCGTYLKNETPDKYNIDGFRASLGLSDFLFMERSWAEQDDYVTQAVDMLPEHFRKQAIDALAEASEIPQYSITGNAIPVEITSRGTLMINDTEVGLFTFQTMGFTDFRAWTATMMSSTSAKAGMQGSDAVRAAVNPEVVATDVERDGRSKKIICRLDLRDEGIDSRLFPEEMYVEYDINENGREIDMVFTLKNKPANRMVELYWISFMPSHITSIKLQKMGYPVDVGEVILGGNFRMAGIDGYVSITTANSTFTITSYDVPVVLVGDRDDMSYKVRPDMSKGVHFNLFNNLWGVNYSMWWEGSQRFRFKIEHSG